MAIELRWSHGGTGGDVYVCDGTDGCGLEVRAANEGKHRAWHDWLAGQVAEANAAWELATRHEDSR